jgi:pentatricopeptide repeat protein
VCRGGANFKEAWEFIEMMEKSGTRADHYTISIMMKALKKVRNPKDVGRVLALLDKAGVDVCSDEILLNTTLETCIRHHESKRLDSILRSYAKSGLKPSVHTYGSLIKSCGSLKRIDQCREFWREMDQRCGMEPNDIVLGCMLDALVCNGAVDEAVELLEKWKGQVRPNTVMYSTIIKGFATSRQNKRAMEMWKMMRSEGIVMNVVLYNALIDSQARVGAMDEVSELVESMEGAGCIPDVISYSTIVKGYCVKGDLDKALEVFRGMQKNKMAGDSIVYNTLLDGCTRHGRRDLCEMVLEDMEKSAVVPSNFTLGILVKMYGRQHELEKAFKVARARRRLTPNLKSGVPHSGGSETM